jgi:hypothetical protein
MNLAVAPRRTRAGAWGVGYDGKVERRFEERASILDNRANCVKTKTAASGA